MAPKNETARAESKAETRGYGFSGFERFFPLNFSQLHMDNTAALTRANEVLLQTARSIWESETELFRLGMENARNSFGSWMAGSPAQSFSEMLAQCHRNSEQAITHMRGIGDVMRECEWQVLGIAAQSLAVGRPEASK